MIIVQLLLLILQLVAFGILVFYMYSMVKSDIMGAPYVPMSQKYVKELLAFGGLTSGDILCDLGCGDGRILREAVTEFHVREAIGYERAPWPVRRARWLNRNMPQIEIRKQDIFSADMSRATFVYVYLYPKLVDRLATKLAEECRPGTRILCPSFPINLEKHPQFQLLKKEKIGTITAYLYRKN